ncbi:hypothetical protein SAE02_03500 [Skermanella aerolata]|uniref:Uncharacterized protein n=1 Tax=Skermanella aerolata TaxID=393310 RepID=A0A512DIB6_9PROT|nr:hypothetical protein SAE02_03500 [Skermanella aerolata]
MAYGFPYGGEPVELLESQAVRVFLQIDPSIPDKLEGAEDLNIVVDTQICNVVWIHGCQLSCKLRHRMDPARV